MKNKAVTPSAVRIRGLRVERGGREVLHGLDLDVPTGQIVGILGPSGCGKSTLLRSIVGVQGGVSGECTVLGETPGSKPLRPRVGYVTQAPSVYSDLTVRQNLAHFATLVGAERSRVEQTLDDVGLNSHADVKVSRLSGGQASRVSLGAALVGEPDLLVLDEPTVGLDPVLRRDLWALFRRLADAGTTLLVSSHVMDEAVRCDRLILLREGVILADGPLDDLLAETGAADADGAFLTLVDRAGQPHTEHPSTADEEGAS